MAGMISTAALAVVLSSALYLLVLGGSALVQPELARRFLGAFATTRGLHFTELALRILVGAALISSAPHMAGTLPILLFGWVLVGSSIALSLLPWRLHQRFAAWSVPQAMPYLPLIGVASLAGGFGLIAAVILSPAAV
jgi:hypothetical protein